MRATLLLIPLLAAPAWAASAVSAPFAFDLDTLSVVVRRLSPPSVDALLGELKDADRRRQMEILDELPLRAGTADSAAQHRLAWALRDLADSQQAAPEVRARSLYALGRCERWMGDAAAQKDAIETLETEALRDDMNRLTLQPYALEGLVEAAGRLPRADQSVADGVAETALEVLRRQRPALERTLAARVLAVELASTAVQPLWQKLGGRFDDELLRPAEGAGGCYDPNRNSVEARLFMMQVLDRLAWGALDSGVRHRVKQIFRQMSENEPEPQLKRLARLYEERLRD
jgi:hypothetical protein